jgi:hypothetical protein
LPYANTWGGGGGNLLRESEPLSVAPATPPTAASPERPAPNAPETAAPGVGKKNTRTYEVLRARMVKKTKHALHLTYSPPPPLLLLPSPPANLAAANQVFEVGPRGLVHFEQSVKFRLRALVELPNLAREREYHAGG